MSLELDVQENRIYEALQSKGWKSYKFKKSSAFSQLGMNVGEWNCARSGLKNYCFSDNKDRNFVYGCSVQFQGVINEQNCQCGMLKIHIKRITLPSKWNQSELVG